VEKKRLVILGTGWGSSSLIKSLDNIFEVIIISPRNYFLFSPLLPSVTNGTLEERSIIEPVRKLCKKTGQTNVQFYEAKCVDIDPANNMITCEDESKISTEDSKFQLKYDYLVVGVGADNNTFGTPGVYENTNFLKSIEDARDIRSKIMDAFETANLPTLTEQERKNLLSFVIVGGGPTGVEYAAELNDFVNEDLKKWFPKLIKLSSIHLIQSADHLLNTFDKKISEYTEKSFKEMG